MKSVSFSNYAVVKMALTILRRKSAKRWLVGWLVRSFVRLFGVPDSFTCPFVINIRSLYRSLGRPSVRLFIIFSRGTCYLIHSSGAKGLFPRFFQGLL